MALSVGATWVVASVAAAVTFAVGTTIVVLFVRRRHRRLTPSATELARRLSAYHPSDLGMDDTNYLDIPPPTTTRLRRSTQLPGGVVQEGWADLPSHQSIRFPPLASRLQHQGIGLEWAQPKRYQSLRATLSPYSVQVPGTRRQKKIKKTTPRNMVGWSPLSAITEVSDPAPRPVSTAINAVELPAETTPTTTPPSHRERRKSARSISAEWPLRNDLTMLPDAVPTATGSFVKRNNTFIGIESTHHRIGSNGASRGYRSVSMGSTISMAPDDPLPPLPAIPTTRYPESRNSTLRSSVASTDTVSSSLLHTGILSVLNDRADHTGLSSSLPWEYDSIPDGHGTIAVAIGTPPGTQASRGLRLGAAGIGSFRATIDQPLSTSAGVSQLQGSSSHEHHNGLRAPAITTLDANVWDMSASAGRSSLCKSVSPSLATPVVRRDLSYPDRGHVARHSMYEQPSKVGKPLVAPDVLQNMSASDISPFPRPLQPRPASVGTVNPFQWVQKAIPTLKAADLDWSLSTPRPCHATKNYSRISGLPFVDGGLGAHKLPRQGEDGEQPQPQTPIKQRSNIPGQSFVNEDDDSGHRPVFAQPTPFPTPFSNRPILYPTSDAYRAMYRRSTTTESSGSPRSEADVFSSGQHDPKAPNIFASKSPDRKWPLSPTPLNNIKRNSTLSTTSTSCFEPYNPELPILPSPTVLSTTLFPPKSTLYGPRHPLSAAASRRSSRTASPSPLRRVTHKPNSSATATKMRGGDDLRRSVMTLRRTSSDLDCRSPDRVLLVECSKANEFASTRNSSSMQKDDNLAPLPLTIEKRPAPIQTGTSIGGDRHINGRHRISHCSSMLSSRSASVWEDASVEGESPELEPRVLAKHEDEPRRAPTIGNVDPEASENLGVQEWEVTARQSKSKSPRRTGLGLMGFESMVVGTPASLYDRDGFLKD